MVQTFTSIETSDGDGDADCTADQRIECLWSGVNELSNGDVLKGNGFALDVNDSLNPEFVFRLSKRQCPFWLYSGPPLTNRTAEMSFIEAK